MRPILKSCRWLLWVIPGLVVFGAGCIKVVDPVTFYEVILSYRIVTGRLALAMVWTILSLEISLPVALLIRPFRLGAAWLLLGLLILFTGLGITARLRGLEVPCGCFGAIGSEGHWDWQSMLRNAALIFLLGIYCRIRLNSGAATA